MKKIAVLLSLLMLLPTLGCAVNAASGEISANLGQQVELKPGQTVSINGESIELKFIEVISDSRCPEGAMCIWAGQVKCTVEITYLGSVYQVTLTQPDPGYAFEDYIISFNVLPYPKLGVDIESSDYSLQVTINQKATIEDTKWFLESYGKPGSYKSVISDTRITATFMGIENHVGGSAGCNIYGGTCQINGSEISITGVYATEMACIEPGVMIQEQEFLNLLMSAQSFSTDEDKLTIFCANGQQLNFSSIVTVCTCV
jgi:heat shock protein HslJ